MVGGIHPGAGGCFFFLLPLEERECFVYGSKTFWFCDFRGCCAPYFQRDTVQLDHPSFALYRGEKDFRSRRNASIVHVP